MKHFLILILLLAGCGPSAEERYNTALSILKSEREELNRLQPGYDAAGATAVLTVSQELSGSPLPRDFEPPPEEIAANIKNIEKSGPEAADKAIDQLLEEERKMGEQTARLKEASQKVMDPDSPEYKRMLELFSQTPEFQAYQKQRDRVDRAEKAVAEAEASLTSSGPR